MANPGSRRSWLMGGAVATVVALVLVGGWIAVTSRDDSSGRDEVRALSGLPRGTSVAFLGDSFTQGAIASTPALRWSSLVARRHGWVETNFGVGGTGYQATGVGEGPYAQRIPAVAAARPKLVIVSGGLNDLAAMTQAPTTEAAAVGRTFRALRQAMPTAIIVAVRPFWNATVAPPILATLARDVRASVRASGGLYADIGQPLADRPGSIGVDGIHPDDSGHALLARAVDRALAALRPPA